MKQPIAMIQMQIVRFKVCGDLCGDALSRYRGFLLFLLSFAICVCAYRALEIGDGIRIRLYHGLYYGQAA